MAEFLCEILCEEIPARMQKKTVEQMGIIFAQILKEKGLNHSEIKTFITPRRMTIFIENLDSCNLSMTEEKRGTKVGAPEQAISGFLKANNLSKEQLFEKDGYWYVLTIVPTKQTKELLPEILEQFFKNFTWSKSMSWPQSKQSWIRPMRNILCLFDGKNLGYDLTDLGLVCNNLSFGHHFLSNETFIVESFTDYQRKLKENSVMLCQDKRKAKITEDLKNLAESQNLILQEDAGLLEEVTGLVEYPYVGLGKIDDEFMALPDIILTTSMRVHQKYFTFKNSNGSMAPYFGVVANVPVTTKILEGYERVLRARLRDALFFYEQDLKTPLEYFIKKSGELILYKSVAIAEKRKVIQSRLKYFDALYRNNELNSHTHMHHINYQDASKVIEIDKFDLVTHMVEEFPELQGKMGEIYALRKGFNKNLAEIIREIYQPHGLNDQCPKTEIGAELAFFDKLHDLVLFFVFGIKPSGSKDPFGLRRCALGIIRLVCEKNLAYELRAEIEYFINAYKDKKINISASTIDLVLSFLKDRFFVFLKDKGFRYDHINACLDSSINEGYFYEIQLKCKILQDFLSTENGINLLTAFKRCNGILGQNNYAQCNIALFETENEKKLHEAIINLNEKAGFIHALADIRPIVDGFFNNVTVNTDNLQLTNNRLALLQMLRDTMLAFCDWRKIEG